MKNTVLIVAMSLALSAISQGNLQFNQVLRPTVSAVNLLAYGTSTVQLTVPEGKVWKVESADLYRTTSGGVGAYLVTTSQIRFGEQLLNTCYLNAQGLITPSFPKWFPPGTYNFTIQETWGSSYSGQTLVGVMNVIEFNVVP